MSQNPLTVFPEEAALPADLLLPRIPRATYRLQFNNHFTFRDAQAIVPYLHQLGISDCYASPILLARPGSQHGYDVCDPGRLNPELGTPDDFDALVVALQAHQMGLLLDTVPNHMGVNANANSWWIDVLENGPSSDFALFFDIDWHPIKAEIANKILLPILGDLYGDALEQGHLRLVFERGAFWISVYDDLRLPVTPHTYRVLLRHRLPELRAQLGEGHEHLQEVESIITALDHLPVGEVPPGERRAEQTREKEVVKRRLAALYQASPVFKANLEATITTFNGIPDDQASFDLLDDLIAEQYYRPAFWRVAAEEINYRRFFDVNMLAAVQVEYPAVFEATHRLIFALMAQGKVTGLRIDHPDGLWNPGEYFRQLQARAAQDRVKQWRRTHAESGSAIDAPFNPEASVPPWPAPTPENVIPAETAEAAPSDSGTLAAHVTSTAPRPWPLYVVVEKILSEREPLPGDWPVFGTTGYDFLNSVNDLLIAHEHEKELTRIYREFAIGVVPFANRVTASKRLIMNSSLSSEILALAHQLERITERNRRYRDYTLNSVDAALRDVITFLQVYRTYTNTDLVVSERDEYYITRAVADAKVQPNSTTPAAVLDFLEDCLLLRNLGQFRAADRQAVVDFVMKFQQVTGPVMAKSMEDTAFYNYNRLVSLNEVGGHPDQFGASVGAFHEANAARSRDWPHALLTTSTHDTKRSEDVRARLAMLSEIPEQWAAAVSRWHALLAPYVQWAKDSEMPSRNDEYLLYQTLVGIWPPQTPDAATAGDLHQRVEAYMLKAVQEAKSNSSWINPNGPYLAALSGFIAALFALESGTAFREDLQGFVSHVAFFGRFNALTQTLLKLAAPGVPDIYQGLEVWDDSLVDPDNRRPVDFRERQQQLHALVAAMAAEGNGVALCQDVVAHAADGRIKLYTIAASLDLRRRRPAIFADGGYRPLEPRGDLWSHLCAFARTAPEGSAIAVAPRLIHKLTEGREQAPLGKAIWHDTWLSLPDEFANRHYRDVFTGRSITVSERDGVPALEVAALLQDFPVALLEDV